jgi:hypothetical protein
MGLGCSVQVKDSGFTQQHELAAMAVLGVSYCEA